MGIPGWCRKALKRRYPAAFPRVAPENVQMALIDMMQYVKYVPDNIYSVADYVQYLVRFVRWEFQRERRTVVVVCVDRLAVPVKRIMCYTARYKNTDEAYSEDDAPFLHSDGLLPESWSQFAANRKLMRRELYPRLYNELIRLDVPMGCSLLLHGFPGVVQTTQIHSAVWDTPVTLNNAWARRKLTDVVLPWSESALPISERDEQNDPDLYNRVYIVENIVPCPEFPGGARRVAVCEGLRNEIREADLGVFYYDHCYPKMDQMIIINDGDAIPIALLYAADRLVNNAFRNRQFIKLPRRKRSSSKNKNKSPFRYVDVNRLVMAMRADPEFGKAGVQNHEATWAMLLALDRTDFFRGHLKGIGVKTVAWPLFMEMLPRYSHLVQLSKSVLPCTRTPRRVVIDEDLWRLFINECYLQKYSAGIRRKRRKTTREAPISYDQLRQRCAKTAKGTPQQDADQHLPSRNTVRRWGRQLLWNLLYWANGMRGASREPDPFERYDGDSYFGYQREPTLGLAPHVSARQKPVDEVYARHFYRNTRKYMEKRRQRRNQNQKRARVSTTTIPASLTAEINSIFPSLDSGPEMADH